MSTITAAKQEFIESLTEQLVDAETSGASLHYVFQRLASNELARIEEQFRLADDRGTNVDIQAIRALLAADELDGVLSEIKNQVSGVKQAINEKLTEQFGLLDVQSMNVDNRTVYRNVEKYANAKPEHRQDLVKWARENELEDMIVVQPQRFKSWCREQIENGGLPEEIASLVDVFEKPSLRIRRS